MSFPDEFVSVGSVEEAVSLLQKFRDQARIVAGGTEFHELLAKGMMPQVKKLIDIQRLGLDYIKAEGDIIKIGAMATHRDVYNFFVKDGRYKALAEAAHLVPVQTRNAATVGGCVASSITYFDLPVALMAFDAKIVAHGSGGERVVNIDEFFVDYLLANLNSDEFIKEVQIPQVAEGTVSNFVNFKMSKVSLPVLCVAIKVTLKGDKVCKDARIALGSAARVAVRVKSAEKQMVAKQLSPSVFEEVAETVGREVKPLDDIRASAEYRRYLSKILVKRALLEVVP